MTFDKWIGYFVDEGHRERGFADVNDPFRMGMESRACIIPYAPTSRLDQSFIYPMLVSKALSRATFLVMWISNFLIPDAKVCRIRPSTFVSIVKLAMGTRLALVSAVLVHIYCRLREMVTYKASGYSSVAMPLPIIYR